MAKFLRDQLISSVKVDEDLILQLDAIFKARVNQLKLIIGDNNVADVNPVLNYTLRFDGKGIRFFDVEELLSHFRSANDVERLAIAIETSVSISTNLRFGEYIDFRLDKNNVNNCLVQVSADDSDWVDASYSSIIDAVNKNKTRYRYARSSLSGFCIQMLGVVSAFLLSLWAAIAISPNFKVENSFVLVFLFSLLIFSNIWTHLSNFIISKVYNIFPNILFYRAGKPGMNWLYQALVGGAALSMCLYAISALFGVVGQFLMSLTQ